MEKYVAVIDEDGSFLEATYPRRARGLVKKGRARFVDKDETTICLIKQTTQKQDDNCDILIDETQSCLSDMYYNYFIKLSEDAGMNDQNNINNNEDIETKIDSEIDRLVNDAIDDAMGEGSGESDQGKNEIDTDVLLKSIKAGLKETFGAANTLAKKGFNSAKDGIKDAANSFKGMISNIHSQKDENCDEECECDEPKKHENGKFDIKIEKKDGKIEGMFGSKEFKFNDPFQFKNNRKAESSALTMDFITSRIDLVIENMSHLVEAVNAVNEMELNESPNGGFGDAERAKTIRATVELREQTNKEILSLLNKMYEDLMAPVRFEKKDPSEAALDAHITKVLELNDIGGDEKIAMIDAIARLYRK